MSYSLHLYQITDCVRTRGESCMDLGKDSNSDKSTASATWSGGGSGSSTPGRFFIVFLVSTKNHHLGSRVLSSARPQGEVWSSLECSEEIGEETAREGAR